MSAPSRPTSVNSASFATLFVNRAAVGVHMHHFEERGVGETVWINSSCVASKFPRNAEAPLSEYSPIEADSAKVLALHDPPGPEPMTMMSNFIQSASSISRSRVPSGRGLAP